MIRVFVEQFLSFSRNCLAPQIIYSLVFLAVLVGSDEEASLSLVHLATGSVKDHCRLASVPADFAARTDGSVVCVDAKGGLSVIRMADERSVSVKGVAIDAESLPRAGWRGSAIFVARKHSRYGEVLRLDIGLALA